jgi:hypothetical protein
MPGRGRAAELVGRVERDGHLEQRRRLRRPLGLVAQRDEPLELGLVDRQVLGVERLDEVHRAAAAVNVNRRETNAE